MVLPIKYFYLKTSVKFCQIKKELSEKKNYLKILSFILKRKQKGNSRIHLIFFLRKR